MKMASLAVLAVVGIASFASPVLAVSSSELDAFGVDLDNWSQGSSGGLSRVSSGGPGGVADSFMRLAADGSGSHGKLTAFNDAQWTGNYSAAGIGSLAADFKSFDQAGQTLHMRLALKSDTGNSAGYVTGAFDITNDGNWHHAVFLLDAAHLTAVNGAGPLDTFLTGINEVRIVQGATPSVLGDPVVSVVGIDNIQAIAVPEPVSLGLLSLASFGILRRRR